MFVRICFCLIAIGGLFACPTAQAQDPFGFQFGYTLGMQNSFRNRLPTPPYFSVYPPVYYGQRFARPYGDSPYASFPQLQPAPGYHAVPMEGHFVRPRHIVNPHVAPHPHTPHVQISEDAGTQPVAGNKGVAKEGSNAVVIVNPYAQEQYVSSK